MMNSIRPCAVNGRFYPNGNELTALLKEITLKEMPKFLPPQADERMTGGIVPHAAYFYSGYQAVHFFNRIKYSREPIETFVIIHPSHHYSNPSLALSPHHYWDSPSGLIPLDTELAACLQLPANEQVHLYEHSAEVMLPMLQHFVPYSFKILPVAMCNQQFDNALSLAEKLHIAANRLSRSIMIIASSDFSHFVSPDKGQKLDDLVINEILSMHTANVEKVVHKNRISVCGYGPIMCLMEYSKLSSRNPKGLVLRRGHSGEVHKSSEVVDYISIAMFNQD